MEPKIKEILEAMVDNNSPHWKVKTVIDAHCEISRLYKNDAKAKAFDKLLELKAAYDHGAIPDTRFFFLQAIDIIGDFKKESDL